MSIKSGILLMNLLYLSMITIRTTSASHLQHLNVSVIERFIKEWTFHGWHLDDEEPVTIGKDNKFVYINYEFPGKRSGPDMKVNISYDSINTDGTVTVQKCNYELKSSIGKIITHSKILSHAGDRVLLRYVDFIKEANNSFAVYLWNRMIDMSTCKYKEINRYGEYQSLTKDLNVPYTESDFRWFLDSKQHIVQFEDGSYDTFIVGLDLCNAARCRQQVTNEGTLKGKIVPYIPKKYWLNLITFHQTQSTDQYFAIVKDFTFLENWNKRDIKLTLLYAWPGGKVKELLNLKKGKGYYDSDGTKKYLTACWSEESKIANISDLTCVQYDSDGKLIFNETFVLPYNISALRVTNLKNGGFLILTQECKSDKMKSNGCMEGDDVYYVRYCRQGWPIGPAMEIEGFNDKSLSFNEISPKYSQRLTSFISYDDKKNIICISIFLEGSVLRDEMIRKKKFWIKCSPASFIMPQ